jgi:hypothetical protein
MGQTIALASLDFLSAQTILWWGTTRFLKLFIFEIYFKSLASMILENLMIPATPSRNFGNMN